MRLPRITWSPQTDEAPTRIQDLFPAVEGLLHVWAARLLEPIPVAISSAYQLPSRIPKTNPRPSAQEKWVTSREAVSRVDAAVRRLPEPERTYVVLRYYYLARPGWIAKALRWPQGRVQAVRNRALALLAAMLFLRPADTPHQTAGSGPGGPAPPAEVF